MSDSIHTILCNKKISLTVKGKIAQITVRKRCNPSAFLVFLLLTKAGLNCPNLRFDGCVFPTYNSSGNSENVKPELEKKGHAHRPSTGREASGNYSL